MAEYKPIGSEKLKTDDKLQRILELTYYDRDKKNNKSKKADLTEHSKTGSIYSIVKEKDGYYVKKGINESSMDYIGGMFMKNKNKFSSYSEALKKLEFLKGQEELLEATKYVLKKKPNEQEGKVGEAPMPDAPPAAPIPDDSSMPAPDMPPPAPDASAAPDAGMPSPDAEMPPTDGGDMTEPSNEKGEDMKRSDYMSEIQKYSGKLGQELRDQKDKLESDDIKYVINMIISAVDLDKLEDEDLEDIRDKFEKDEDDDEPEFDEEMPPSDEEMPPSDEQTPPSDEVQAPPTGEKELGEYMNPMDRLENFINNDLDLSEEDDIDFNRYSMSESDSQYNEDDDIVEVDMDLINSEINEKIKSVLGKYFK